MRDTGIADRLRSKGLLVVEVAGWQTRGSDYFAPLGSVDHHTAGSSRGNAPSLRICTYGRAGLSGPLCNVLVGRDNTCYVIAAGRANHAGRGGWNGLRGNSSVYGVERENVGTTAEPWRDDQHLVAGVVHAALIEGVPGGGANPQNVCEHKEWAPNRKVDAHSVDGNKMRELVAAVIRYPQSPPDIQGPQNKPVDPAAIKRWVAGLLLPLVKKLPDLDGNSSGTEVKILQQALNLVTSAGLKEDGLYGPATIQAVLNFQRFFGIEGDFPGAAHRFTRFYLVEILRQFMTGEL